MKKATLPLLLAVGYALLLPSLSPADTVVEEIIARVNNEMSPARSIVRSLDHLKQEVQQQDAANADRFLPTARKTFSATSLTSNSCSTKARTSASPATPS